MFWLSALSKSGFIACRGSRFLFIRLKGYYIIDFSSLKGKFDDCVLINTSGSEFLHEYHKDTKNAREIREKRDGMVKLDVSIFQEDTERVENRRGPSRASRCVNRVTNAGISQAKH